MKYYFKFIVPCHYAKEFNTFEEAAKESKKKNEKIYITIFSTENIYKEPYDEIVIKEETEIKQSKIKLIQSFNKQFTFLDRIKNRISDSGHKILKVTNINNNVIRVKTTEPELRNREKNMNRTFKIENNIIFEKLPTIGWFKLKKC
jgi:hypothetical protein